MTACRFVWVRRASLYHSSRLRLNSFYRKRTPLDDLLIADMCELSLSGYVQIRRSAQKGLDAMTHYFDGTRTILYDRLFEGLKGTFSISPSLYGTDEICSWIGSRHDERSALRPRIQDVPEPEYPRLEVRSQVHHG